MRTGLNLIAILSVTLITYGCATQPGPVGAIAPLEAGLRAAPDTGEALPAVTTAIPQEGGAAAVPVGFISFCTRFPDQCAAPTDASSVITLDSARWLVLEAVNESVNRAIRPLEDQRHYSRAEYWNIPTDGYGDCEDYVVTKRKELAMAGLPESALRIALVVTPRNERHSVLTVSTDRGDFVLDNLRSEIVGWDKSGYQWIERQNPLKAWGWVALGTANPAYVASMAGNPIGTLH